LRELQVQELAQVPVQVWAQPVAPGLEQVPERLSAQAQEQVQVSAQVQVQARALVPAQVQALARVLVRVQALVPVRQHPLLRRPPQSPCQRGPFHRLALEFLSAFPRWAMELRCPLCRWTLRTTVRRRQRCRPHS
jgi:hypothetical protein